MRRSIHSVVILCVLALAVPAFAQFGCPSQSQAAAPLSPDGTSFTQSSLITFRWRAATVTATKYEVYTSADGFRTPICEATGTNSTQCSSSDKFDIGTYQWLVKTQASFCVGGTDSATKQFTICDPITISPTSLSSVLYGNEISVRFSATGGSGEYSWRKVDGTLPANVEFTETGELLGAPRESGTFSFTVTATDTKGCTGSRFYTLKVCPIISISPASLPDGTQGVAYNAPLSATPSGPYAFTQVVANTLPPGLFVTNSAITGTPTKPGKYTFAIRATDSNGCSESKTYDLTINCPTIAMGPSTLPSATQNTNYQQFLTATGGTSPYTFTLLDGHIPDRLGLASDGKLTGIPTETGNFAFNVKVTDANGCTATRSYALFVAEPCTTVFGPATLPNATLGADYSQTLTPAGGTAPYTFTLSDGTLPTGFSLDSAGKISGTAKSEGTFTFTIKVADAKGCTNSRSYTITVGTCATIKLSPSSLGDGTVNTSYGAEFSAAGGDAPYTFGISDGSLPRGLSLDSAGKLSGTPTESGIFSFTVTARDKGGCTGSERYSLTIKAQQSCPSAPTLISPINGESVFTGSVTLKWNAAANATIYEVFAGFNGATPSSLGTTTGTQLTVTINSAGAITWYVRASVSGNTICFPKDSTTERFVVVKECRNDNPTLVTPLDGAEVTLPATFEWRSVTNAIGYKLYVDSALVGTTTSATKFITSSLSSGKHDWYVTALFDGCDPTESAHRTVVVATQNDCPTGKTTLVSPKSGAVTGNPVTFEWTAVKDAAKYRLVVAVDGGTPTTIALTDLTKFEVKMPGTTIEWWVNAIFEGTCPSTESEHFRFSMKGDSTCPTNPGVATPIAPANGATNQISPVTFQWSPVTGATLYRVIATITTATTTSTSTLGTSTTTSLTASLPASTVTWLVETQFGDDCPTTISSRSTFTVSTGACKTTAPTPLSPPNGATNVLSPVTFKWSDVGAASYSLFIATGGSADLSFAGQGTTTEVTKIVPEGTVRWLVIAHFAGCDDVRSNVFTFSAIERTPCADARIDRKSPADGTTQTSPVTFAWSEIPGATYRLWASLDGGAFGIITQTTSTSATINIPSGEIEWFVDAPRADCPTVVSSHGKFTVPRANNCNNNQPATLVSPINDATAKSPVDFKWNAAPNAIAYRLWVVPAGKAPVDLGITKDTHLERELPAATYVWFVDALFDGCPPVSSARATFKINEDTPRCSTNPPSTISPANGQIITSPVDFLWSQVDGAIEYRVYISVDGATPILIGTTSETSLTKTLAPGKYIWAVEAVFKGCPSTISSRTSFTIPQQQNCRGDKPQLVSPRDNDNNVTPPVDFVWNPVSGAVRYIVVVRRGNDVPTPVGETTDTTFEVKLPPGRYEWGVIAQFAGCPPQESTRFHFEIPAPPQCDNRRPIILTPENGADVTLPVHLSWTPVPRAQSYKVWAVHDDGGLDLLASTTSSEASIDVPPGPYRWFVQAFFPNCPPLESARSEFTVLAAPPPCRPPDQPTANVVGQTLSGTPYNVRWTALPFVTSYELQEATAADFSNAQTRTIEGVSATFTHNAGDTPAHFLYRVRGISPCSDERGQYSEVVGIFIVNPKPNAPSKNASAEIGVQGNIVQTLSLPPANPPVNFHAEVDKPWLKVTPSDGVDGPAGVTLTVTADPNVLVLGTNTGTVKITYSGAGKGQTTNASTLPSNVPVSVSLVTPVSPGGNNTPVPDSLIIPAVAHAAGANDSLFESDIRITNLAPEVQQYLINFTPSGVDGTLSGSSTFLEIEPGATTALDDILASFFNSGTTGKVEIRPLSANSSTTSIVNGIPTVELTTAASSRTYNVTANGTFGQYIPAIRYADFISKSTGGTPEILSLQQISQSAAYRTNFGFVEGAGEPADLVMTVFNAAGQNIAEIPIKLQAGEHKQLNALLAANGINDLADGRVEIEVTSDTGKVTAYASTLDNKTNDPLLVPPVLKSSVSANRYVLPGMAYINNGLANWRSDVRVFNAGGTGTQAALTYYPQGNPSAAQTRTLSLGAGEMKVLDNVLSTIFGIADPVAGGSIAVSTESNTPLITTARTYNQTSNGTYGQFIPGITPGQAVGRGERALQLLQLEQSSRLRTNIGVTETTGKPATVEVSVVLPDSKATPVIAIPLQANEFRQFSLADFGLGSAIYNARVTVKVIDGDGRATAYGSAIDMLTQDPTYVFPQ